MWQCEKLLIHREKWRRGDSCFIREKINSVAQGNCEPTLHFFQSCGHSLRFWSMQTLSHTEAHNQSSLEEIQKKPNQNNNTNKNFFSGLEPMLTSRRTNNVNTFTEQKMGWELLYSSPSRNNSSFKYSIETTLYFELTLANVYL